MGDTIVIRRIARVGIHRFRGFIGSGNWDTDADLVVLLGPNGTGKTSFVEALHLLLTGVPVIRTRPGHPVDYSALLALQRNVKSGTGGNGNARRCHDFELEADVVAQGASTPKKVLRVQGRLSTTADGRGNLTLERSSKDLEFPPDPFPARAMDRPADGKSGEPSVIRPLFDGKPYAAESVASGAWLQSRLSAFFQHDVGRVFDDAAEGRTVLDLSATNSVRMRCLDQVLERVVEVLEDRLKRESERGSEPTEEQWSVIRRYRDALESLFEVLNQVAPVSHVLPDALTAPVEAADILARCPATEFARVVASVCEEWGSHVDCEDVPYRLRSVLVLNEPRWRAAFERRAMGAASKDEVQEREMHLEAIKREEEEIRTAHPNLDDEAVAFSGATVNATGQNGEPYEERLPDLLLTLRALRAGLPDWLRSAREGRGPLPEEVRRELEAIRRDALAAVIEAMAEWRCQLDTARRRRGVLATERDELQKKISERQTLTEELQQFSGRVAAAEDVPAEPWKQLIAWERWKADTARREQRCKALLDMKSDVETCRKRLDEVRKCHPEVLQQLKRSLNEISRRFSIVGRPAIEVDVAQATVREEGSSGDASGQAVERASARAKLRYKDGRSLAELSSGQHSQMATAFLVAQNLLVAQGMPPLDRGMPHRVLLLDDVSSTYDLTNLVRESILWRQLAYTDDLARKRQVFISSHHEDLSNQLIDHLVPPKGFAMKVLRFKGWSPDTGPEIEAFEVEPAANQKDDSACRAFQTNVEALFHGGK